MNNANDFYSILEKKKIEQVVEVALYRDRRIYRVKIKTVNESGFVNTQPKSDAIIAQH